MITVYNLVLKLILINLFFSLTIFAQETWIRTFGGTGIDVGKSVIQTDDGGYVIAGYTNSFGAGGSDVYLLKVNAYGYVIWEKTYGGQGNDSGNHVIQTNDNCFIIVGTTNSFGNGNNDVFLIKTDTRGNTIWTKTYGQKDYENGKRVRQTYDGGYIVLGSISPGNKVYLIKTDPIGNLNWHKIYSGYGEDVLETEDNGFIILSNGYSETTGLLSIIFLIKTDCNGDTIWKKTIIEPDSDVYGNSLIQTKDGDYIITGGFAGSDFTQKEGKLYLLKTDSYGNKIWSKNIGERQTCRVGYCVQQTNNEGYITAGTIFYNLDSDLDYYRSVNVYLSKFNLEGDTLWTKTVIDEIAGEAYSIQKAFDKGYIIIGEAYTSDTESHNIYLIKTDSLGYINKEATIITKYYLFQNFPNPFNSSTKIFYKIPERSKVILDVYNILGQKIRTLVNRDSHHEGIFSVSWDGKNNYGSCVSSGVYFYRLKTDKFVETKKMLLIR